MRKKNQRSLYYPPQADDFKTLRKSSCLSVDSAALFLHVSPKTIKNWESGRTAVPYASYKLLRMLGNFDLPSPAWSGWCLRDGKLWTPSNRSFEPHELIYIAGMFSMARFWIAERKAVNETRLHFRSKSRSALRVIQGGGLPEVALLQGMEAAL